MKKNLKTVFFFLAKKSLLRKYNQIHLIYEMEYGTVLMKHWINYASLFDQLNFIYVNTDKTKTKKYLKELMDNMDKWKYIDEMELLSQFDKYSKIIYKLSHKKLFYIKSTVEEKHK